MPIPGKDTSPLKLFSHGTLSCISNDPLFSSWTTRWAGRSWRRCSAWLEWWFGPTSWRTRTAKAAGSAPSPSSRPSRPCRPSVSLGSRAGNGARNSGVTAGGEWRLYSKGGYCHVREGQVVVDGKWKEKRNRDKIPSWKNWGSLLRIFSKGNSHTDKCASIPNKFLSLGYN